MIASSASRAAAALLLTLNLPQTAAAAETGPTKAQASSPRTVDEIVVRASRLGKTAKALPLKVDVFDRDEVRLQQAVSANPTEMLSNLIPSYSASRQKLTNAGETFRGRTPLFLVDGVPQSTPLRPGAREGFTIDMGVVERIEVLFGANAMQGLGGTGGVINYVTVSPPDSGALLQRASASLTSNDGFEHDSFGWRGQYLIGKRFGRFDVTASGAYERRGLLFDGDDRPIALDFNAGDIGNSDSRNFFGKLGFEPTVDQRLQFTINDFYLEQDSDFVPVPGDRARGVPATSVEGRHPGEAPFNDVTTMSLDYTHASVFDGTLTAQAYYQDFASLFGGRIIASFQDPAIAPVGTLFEQSQNNSEKYGTRLTYQLDEIAGTPLDSVLGFDFMRDKTSQPLVLTDRTSVPPTTFYNYAPFVQLNLDLFEWLAVSGGTRWEVADLEVPDYTTRAGNRADFQPVNVEGGTRSFDDVLFNAGAMFTPLDPVTVYATYSEAFSMPDVGRVLRSVSDFGTTVDNLLDIAPLVTENREIGARYTGRYGTFDVAYFESESDFGSRLVARPDGTFDLARQATETSGWELSGTVRPLSWLAIGAGYANLEGEFDSDGNGDLDADLGARDIGPDRLNFTLDVTPPGRFSGRLETFTFFGRTFRDATGARTADFDGYTTVDAVLGMDLARARIDLAVSNLLDNQYITYFGQAATSADALFFAGRGRTLTLRVTAEF